MLIAQFREVIGANIVSLIELLKSKDHDVSSSALSTLAELARNGELEPTMIVTKLTHAKLNLVMQLELPFRWSLSCSRARSTVFHLLLLMHFPS